MGKDTQSPDMGGGSKGGYNSGLNREFLVKGNQVFDAQDPNVPLGILRTSQGGTINDGGSGGASKDQGTSQSRR
jgi:hypothetical protein